MSRSAGSGARVRAARRPDPLAAGAAAAKRADGGELPALADPHVRVDLEVRVVGAVHRDPACLAAAVRAGPPEARRDRDDDAVHTRAEHLELMTFADCRLMNVAAEDQLRAR